VAGLAAAAVAAGSSGWVTWRTFLMEQRNINDWGCDVSETAILEFKKKIKGTVHPCTGTEALYRPYGPWGE